MARKTKKEKWMEYLEAARIVCKGCPYRESACDSCAITIAIEIHNEEEAKADLLCVKRELKNIPGIVGVFSDEDGALYIRFSKLSDDNVEKATSILEEHRFEVIEDEECESDHSATFRLWFERAESE